MKIEVIVSPKGETRIETKGFSGPECRDASQYLERALGTATGEQLTGEFHQARASDQNHIHQGE